MATPPLPATMGASRSNPGQITRYPIPEPELPEPVPELFEPDLPGYNFGSRYPKLVREIRVRPPGTQFTHITRYF